MILQKIKSLLFQKNIYDKNFKILFIIFVLKFLFFDLIWCFSTTFRSFSLIECYLNKALVVLIILLPYVLFKSKIIEFILAFLLDIFLISNLMYFRTYFCEIPLSSYKIAGNLIDFKESVIDSIRWYDIIFPLLSILAIFLTTKNIKTTKNNIKEKLGYCMVCAITFAISLIFIFAKGGLVKAYNHYAGANYHTCGTPIYTLFGSLTCNAIKGSYTVTQEDINKIRLYLNSQQSHIALPDSISTRTNCILIILESFESWVLEKTVEGKEITPYLNKLLKDSSTFYAPKLLTQVKGARSIDAQLLINAGLLPIDNGAYSIKYPQNKYYSITKAFKERNNAKCYLLTVDKEMTWNQGPIAKAFGIDTIIHKNCFVGGEKVGVKKKLGDKSFFKQCVQKIQNGEIWKEGENAFIQLVTYSGHNPFILPDKLHNIKFSKNYPKRIKDYMIMANYTDGAVEKFIEYIKSRPDYKNTLVIITGDHEGLASERKFLSSKPLCKGLVSDKQYTPLIILNSPITGKYSKVMGQIDVYPTLLNLLQLDNYKWKGLGKSIFDKNKKAIAVGPQFNIENEEVENNYKIIDTLKKAWCISDLIIKSDYFTQEGN